MTCQKVPGNFLTSPTNVSLNAIMIRIETLYLQATNQKVPGTFCTTGGHKHDYIRRHTRTYER